MTENETLRVRLHSYSTHGPHCGAELARDALAEVKRLRAACGRVDWDILYAQFPHTIPNTIGAQCHEQVQRFVRELDDLGIDWSAGRKEFDDAANAEEGESDGTQ